MPQSRRTVSRVLQRQARDYEDRHLRETAVRGVLITCDGVFSERCRGTVSYGSLMTNRLSKVLLRVFIQGSEIDDVLDGPIARLMED